MDAPHHSQPVAIHAEITAYSPRSVASQTGHITANGTDTDDRPYAIAAERSIPFGSTVYIPAGHGYCDGVRAFDRSFIVDDRGGGLDSESLRINYTSFAILGGKGWLGIQSPISECRQSPAWDRPGTCRSGSTPSGPATDYDPSPSRSTDKLSIGHIYRLDFRVKTEWYAKQLGRKRLIVWISYPTKIYPTKETVE